MSYLESQPTREIPTYLFDFMMNLYNKHTRRPRVREVQQQEDRGYYVSILKIVELEGHMYKKDIMDLTGWTLSQYGPRMTKLYKEHKGQIKYNKNLKRVDKVKSSKKQENLKV